MAAKKPPENPPEEYRLGLQRLENVLENETPGKYSRGVRKNLRALINVANNFGKDSLKLIEEATIFPYVLAEEHLHILNHELFPINNPRDWIFRVLAAAENVSKKAAAQHRKPTLEEFQIAHKEEIASQAPRARSMHRQPMRVFTPQDSGGQPRGRRSPTRRR